MRNYGFEVEVCYISRKTSSLHYIHINTYPVYFFWIHLTTLIVLRNHRSAILLVIIVLPFRRSFCFLLFVLYVGYLTYSNDVRTKRACKFQAGKKMRKRICFNRHFESSLAPALLAQQQRRPHRTLRQ